MQHQRMMALKLQYLTFLLWLHNGHTEGSCFGMSHNCSQLCTPVRDSFLCLCFHGYSLARDGRTCLDVDECTEYRPCHQICRNTEGGFECACHEGYGLNSTSGECVDKNECLDPGTCLIDGIKRVCVNLLGGYQCLAEVVAQDQQGHATVLFDTEPVEIAESDEEHAQSTPTGAIVTTTADSAAPASPSINTDVPMLPPVCPGADKDLGQRSGLGSTFSSYQLNVIAGCFLAAIALAIVFVIVFSVVQMRRKQRLQSRGLLESPRSASSPSSNVSGPCTTSQWRRNYGRFPKRRSAHRWKPYTSSETVHDRMSSGARSRGDREHIESKMGKQGKNINNNLNNNAAVIPAFV